MQLPLNFIVKHTEYIWKTSESDFNTAIKEYEAKGLVVFITPIDNKHNFEGVLYAGTYKDLAI